MRKNPQTHLQPKTSPNSIDNNNQFKAATEKQSLILTNDKTFFDPKNKPQITIFHQNIQELLSKKELIQLTLLEIKPNINPDVLCFTETYVKTGEEKNINNNNYVLGAKY